MFEGYRNVPNLYPHFPFIYKSVRERFTTYASKHLVISRHLREENHLAYLPWLKVWIGSCMMIEERELRRKAIEDFSYRTLHPKTIAFAAARQRALGRPVLWRDLLYIWFILVGTQKLVWLACLPLFAVPEFVYRVLREWHWNRKYRSRGEAPPDRTQYDPLRL
jgi:hypothetical protein